MNIAHVNNAHRGKEVLSLSIRMHNIELDSISGAGWSQKVGIGETPTKPTNSQQKHIIDLCKIQFKFRFNLKI